MRHLAMAMAAALAALPDGRARPRRCSRGRGASASDVLGARVRVLDGRAAQQYASSTRLRPSLDAHGRGGRGELTSAPISGPYLTLARDAARRHGIPEDLFARLVQQESGWNPAAVSHKGATGLAQLMPGHGRAASESIRPIRGRTSTGARATCAGSSSASATGDWRSRPTTRGPEAVARHGGVPPFAETRGYVVAIMGS